MTLPTMTWPMSSGRRPLWATAALPACTARSVADTPLSAPPMVPNAVRLAPTMTISFASLPIVYSVRFDPVGNCQSADLRPAPGDHRVGALLHRSHNDDLAAIQLPAFGHDGVAGPHRLA